MFRRARFRISAAVLVVLSLLFSQLALANYACPGAQDGTVAVMEMAPGVPCDGVASDLEQTVLCHQHCTNAPQASDPIKLPALSLPAVLHVLVTPHGHQQQRLPAASATPPPSGEPLFLSTRRLRV